MSKSESNNQAGDQTIEALAEKLDRLIAAVEGLRAPAAQPEIDMAAAEAFVWQPEKPGLQPVKRVNRVDMPLLRGIERVKEILIDNTVRFAEGKAIKGNYVSIWH